HIEFGRSTNVDDLMVSIRTLGATTLHTRRIQRLLCTGITFCISDGWIMPKITSTVLAQIDWRWKRVVSIMKIGQEKGTFKEMKGYRRSFQKQHITRSLIADLEILLKEKYLNFKYDLNRL
ncbi:hypothetical protein ACJX0J_040444, partial [Zea mays]